MRRRTESAKNPAVLLNASMPRIRSCGFLPEIQHALDAGAPVVALESSVLAQGLPIPANREAARADDRRRSSAPAPFAAITAVVQRI